MEKIICDICGTEYPETEETCPVCGSSRDLSLDLDFDLGLETEFEEEVQTKPEEPEEEEDFLQDSPISAAVKLDGKFVSAAELTDEFLDELADEDDEEDDEREDDDEEASSRARTGVVILLTIVIILLLTICGFLFVRYLLPNMGEETQPTEQPVQTEAVVETTTQPGLPCEQLILMSGAAVDLSREGEYRLVNVIALPEDTTDDLEYYSADESVATVNGEGRITAMGEGETVVTVFCGAQKVECRVFVRYVEPTEATTVPTEAETEPETQPQETEAQEPEETEAAAATEPTEVTETTEATEAATQPTQSTALKDVVLKLGRTDFSMGVGYEFTIPLDCDLSYEEIEWSTGNPGVAIIENGVIKTISRGTTQLFAKYGDQVVTGWIRVK